MAASEDVARPAALLGPRFITKSIFDAETMKTYRPLFTENFLQKSKQAGASSSGGKSSPDSTPGMDWDRHMQRKLEASEGGTNLRRRKASMIQLQSEDYADFMSMKLDDEWDDSPGLPGAVCGPNPEQSDTEVSKEDSETPSSPDFRMDWPGVGSFASYESNSNARSGLTARTSTSRAHELMTPPPPPTPDGSSHPNGKVRRASSIACLSPLSSTPGQAGVLQRPPSSLMAERSPFAAARSRRASAIVDSALARPASSGECLAEREYEALFLAGAARTRSTIMARRSADVMTPPSVRALPLFDATTSKGAGAEDDSSTFVPWRSSEPGALQVAKSSASESLCGSNGRTRLAASNFRSTGQTLFVRPHTCHSDAGLQDADGAMISALPCIQRAATLEGGSASPRENALSRNFPMLMAAASGPRPGSVASGMSRASTRSLEVVPSPSHSARSRERGQDTSRDSSVRGAATSPRSARGSPGAAEVEPEAVADWIDKIKGIWKPKHKWGSPLKEF